MKQTTLNKLTELLMEYGLDRESAMDRTANIVQALLCSINKMDWISVCMMLAPTEVYSGVDDPITRAQAASEFLRIYLAETSRTRLSSWVGILMYVGDSEEQACQWLTNRGY